MNESKSQLATSFEHNHMVVVNLSISMNESKSQLHTPFLQGIESCSKSQYFNE